MDKINVLALTVFGVLLLKFSKLVVSDHWTLNMAACTAEKDLPETLGTQHLCSACSS